MGQVFTWDDIKSNRIPKIESFKYISGEMRKALYAASSVVSALEFGSVRRGDFNIRSDIDCVVLYETKGEIAAMGVMYQLCCLAKQHHVPINFTPCDTRLARTRLHHLGSSFIRHLRASIEAGGLIKGDLVGFLAETISAEDEIESYIRAKMYNMQESYAQMAAFSEERMASFLKKALESVTHVARKMLIYEGKLAGDSKKQVQGRYRQVMPPRLSKLLDEVLAADSWYTAELARQIRRPDQHQYRDVIKTLKQKIPLVVEFLRWNIIRLDRAAR
jgi:predicted nucleotidyltransferase